MPQHTRAPVLSLLPVTLRVMYSNGNSFAWVEVIFAPREPWLIRMLGPVPAS
jgi:hypothetical protein